VADASGLELEPPPLDHAPPSVNATRAILAELEVLLPLLSPDAQSKILKLTRRLAGG
jgi:hypothetical protein